MQRSMTRLTVLPLNGGDAVYLSGREARTDWLIDCGSESSAEFTTRPFLRAQGVDRLSDLVLSHGDVRHVGGANLVASDFSVGRVWLSKVRFRSPVYRKVVEALGKTPGRLRSFGRGDHLGPWAVLHPDHRDAFTQGDDNTVVLRGDFGSTRVLLLSELGKAGQNALMQRERDLRADIVVSGLPTKTEPLADALLDAIQPRVIVIADADYPATQRASRRLRARLARRRVPVIYTREAGAVTAEFRRNEWQMTTMDQTVLRSEGR
jgi:competence protein ComEC